MRDQLRSSRCCKFLKALAEPDRLKIVQCLQDGPKSVGAVARALRTPVANASHHLCLLKRAGLVSARKQGRYVMYTLAATVLRQRPSAPDVLDFGCCRIELGPR